MTLQLDAGYATSAGIRGANEDFLALATPEEPDRSTKGVIAAIADGVSGNEGGREAAEYTVRGLLTDYYATPDTWPVTQSLERVIQAINSWIQRQGSTRVELAGMATTLTAVVLRGRSYTFAHVGDSRLYLLRAGTLRRLTADHVWDRPEMQHVLTRAVGLDSRVAIDHGSGDLHAGDVLLLVTDGVWAALKEYDLIVGLSDIAAGRIAVTEGAQALVDTALAAGSADNASALVVRIDAVPENHLRDSLHASGSLPVPPRLKPGHTLDGYQVEEVIHASRATLLYRVVDTRAAPAAQRKLVLKTLNPDRGGDPAECAAFAHEEWIARRAVARFFPQVVTPPERHFLYYLTTWHDGHTLRQRLEAGEHFTVPDAIVIGTKLVRALGALHRRSILHRDIKPENIHLGSDDELRVLDFGVAQSGIDAADEQFAPQAGTPSYLAPEQFDNAPCSMQTDLYSVGVTLYHLLTRHYPYGEIEAFQHPRFANPTPPTRYRPDLPVWLENVLLKAVARDPVDRFETAEELLLALERGPVQPLSRPGTVPLARRDPVLLWRLVAVASMVINLLLVYWITVR